MIRFTPLRTEIYLWSEIYLEATLNIDARKSLTIQTVPYKVIRYLSPTIELDKGKCQSRGTNSDGYRRCLCFVTLTSARTVARLLLPFKGVLATVGT